MARQAGGASIEKKIVKESLGSNLACQGKPAVEWRARAVVGYIVQLAAIFEI